MRLSWNTYHGLLIQPEPSEVSQCLYPIFSVSQRLRVSLVVPQGSDTLTLKAVPPKTRTMGAVCMSMVRETLSIFFATRLVTDPYSMPCNVPLQRTR